jgi:hypothetical protein
MSGAHSHKVCQAVSIYTMNWADGVDTWTGDGSPTHTFEHTYHLTNPGGFLFASSISSKFTVSDYAGSHTETDFGYQIVTTQQQDSTR